MEKNRGKRTVRTRKQKHRSQIRSIANKLSVVSRPPSVDCAVAKTVDTCRKEDLEGEGEVLVRFNLKRAEHPYSFPRPVSACLSVKGKES